MKVHTRDLRNLRELISSGKLEEPIHELILLSTSSKQPNWLLQTSARVKALKKQFTDGILTMHEMMQTQNTIRMHLLLQIEDNIEEVADDVSIEIDLESAEESTNSKPGASVDIQAKNVVQTSGDIDNQSINMK